MSGKQMSGGGVRGQCRGEQLSDFNEQLSAEQLSGEQMSGEQVSDFS